MSDTGSVRGSFKYSHAAPFLVKTDGTGLGVEGA